MRNREQGYLKKCLIWMLVCCFTITSSHITVWADGGMLQEAEEKEERAKKYIVDINWDKFQKAVSGAFRGSHFVDDTFLDDFDEDRKLTAEYQQMMLDEMDAPLYQVYYPFLDGELPQKTWIRFFVRRGEVQQETAEYDEAYELTGDETLYVLYGNKSGFDMTIQLRINDFVTEAVYLNAAEEVQEETEEVQESEVLQETKEVQESEALQETKEVQESEATRETEEVQVSEVAQETKETQLTEPEEETGVVTETEAVTVGDAEDGEETAGESLEEETQEQKYEPEMTVESVELSLSRHIVPVVGESVLEDRIGENSDSVLIGTDRNTTLGLTVMTLGEIGISTGKYRSSLIITNDLTEDSEGWSGQSYHYTIMISNSSGQEKIARGMISDYDEDSRTNTVQMKLEPGENAEISNINEKSEYEIVQNSPEYSSCQNIRVEKKKQGWNGSDGEDSGPEDNYGYDPGAYGSLIEQAEALGKAVIRCGDDTGWSVTALKTFLKDADLANRSWNEAYRNRLTGDRGGLWPTVSEEGLDELMLQYFDFADDDTAKRPNDFANQGETFYLNIYVKHSQTEKTNKVIPYISKSPTADDGNRWRAFLIYDSETNSWYGRKDRGFITIAALNSQSVQELLKPDLDLGKVGIVAYGDRTETEDGSDETVTGSFNGNGFAYEIRVGFENYYFYQRPVKYTVTFHYMDKSGNSVREEQVINRYGRAIAPEIPEVDGKEFIDWDKDFSYVTEDLVISARYRDAATEEEPGATDEAPAETEPEETPDVPEETTESLPPETEESLPPETDAREEDRVVQNGDSDSGSGSPASRAAVEIVPEEVPLASLPLNLSGNSVEEFAYFENEEVPLAALPATGERRGNGLALVASGMLLALYLLVCRKKEGKR